MELLSGIGRLLLERGAQRNFLLHLSHSVMKPRNTQSTNHDSELADWWNRVRYGLYAPVYNWVAKPLEGGRERAIDRLALEPDDRVLILGCGTGSDLKYLPSTAFITALDLTPSMVRRTADRADALGLDVDARVGNAQALPFEDDSFDAVLLHLLLSVVPNPGAVAAETSRVLSPDGRVSIYDKFVPEGTEPSLLRRALNPMARFLFSDLTRNLESILAETGLEVESRESTLGGLYTLALARLEPRDASGSQGGTATGPAPMAVHFHY